MKATIRDEGEHLSLRLLCTKVRKIGFRPSAVAQLLRSKPSLLLLVSSLFAQSISVGLSPVLTRLYSPADFGLFGSIAAIVTVFIPLTNLRFECAIPRATTDRLALTLIYLGAFSVVLMGCIYGTIAFCLSLIATQATAAAVLEYWYFIPVALVCAALYEILAMEASRQHNFVAMANAQFRQSFFGVGAQIIIGIFSHGPIGLLVGFLVNQTAGLTILLRALVFGNPFRGSISRNEIRVAAWLERRYPLYSSWSSSLDALNKWSLPLTMSLLWTPAIGGFVFLADRLIGRPMMLTGNALLPVFIARVSKAIREKSGQDIVPAFKHAFRRQFAASIVFTTAVLIGAPLLIPPIFGEGWRESASYIQAMVLVIAPSATLQSVSHIMQLAGRQKAASALIVSKLIATIIIIGTGRILHMEAITVLLEIAVAHGLFAVITYIIYRRIASVLAQQA